jgi:FdhE protein
MSDVADTKTGELNIGEQAKPAFAVLPNPGALFKSRASRFYKLAPGHDLEPYLKFLARLSEAQLTAVATVAASDVSADSAVQAALAHAMPPLGADHDKSHAAKTQAIFAVLDALGEDGLPDATIAAIRALRMATDEQRAALVASALSSETSMENIAERALIFAGLQVHFSAAASRLDAERLSAVADGVCPTCGGAPVASAVVGWPRAGNTRYCSCALCGTLWHVVRVKCVLCSATGGISYHAIEGQSAAVKAECCDACRAYVKIVNQTIDPALDPLADDVATLGLDMLMGEDGWKRGGRNPFLLGY